MSNPFAALGLREDLVRAIAELGFEQPTDIQSDAIPPLLEGRDVLGQAQTGTGKTAAFGLPMLERIDLSQPIVQAIILEPTRELALQVAESIQLYGKYGGVRVAPIYGGASYGKQLRALRDGAHVVVGTPGRVIDLLERGALDLSTVRYVVLDEADRMLDMGFVEAVETILKGTPEDRQTALFSATFPNDVMRISRQYMRDPISIKIARKTLTVEKTEQRYYLVYGEDKLAALMRLMEVEDVKSALIFTRTKIGAAQLAETLIARGYPVEAIHGDMAQDARETVMRRFRQGLVTSLVATDVMARGLDIESVSHVFNFDIPYDAEDYVHRIGRTGRAGREGVAITLVTPRERHLIRSIEQFTKQALQRAMLPTRDDIHEVRDTRFVDVVRKTLDEESLDRERASVTQMIEAGYSPEDIAAAAMKLARQIESLRPIEDVRELPERSERPRGDYERRDRDDRFERGRGRQRTGRESGMVRLMLDLGRADGIQPGDIVGAVASEANISGKAIGAIDIGGRNTYFDVREDSAEKVLMAAARLYLRGKWAKVTIAREEGGYAPREERPRRDFDRPHSDRGGRDDRPPRRERQRG
jgi:ATP-dependent RNA helicase DeaD